MSVVTRHLNNIGTEKRGKQREQSITFRSGSARLPAEMIQARPSFENSYGSLEAASDPTQIVDRDKGRKSQKRFVLIKRQVILKGNRGNFQIYLCVTSLWAQAVLSYTP